MREKQTLKLVGWNGIKCQVIAQGDGRGRTGGLSDGHGAGHDTDTARRLRFAGYGFAGYQQIVARQGEHSTVGNVVDVGAFNLKVTLHLGISRMYVHAEGVSGDAIVKFRRHSLAPRRE